MDVRIGVLHTAKEIELDLPPDTDPHKVRSAVEHALENDERVLWLTDRHGRQVGVPSERIAWVELGSPESKSRIGFGAT